VAAVTGGSELSPLMWGKHFKEAKRVEVVRAIPAGAGRTPLRCLAKRVPSFPYCVRHTYGFPETHAASGQPRWRAADAALEGGKKLEDEQSPLMRGRLIRPAIGWAVVRANLAGAALTRPAGCKRRRSTSHSRQHWTDHKFGRLNGPMFELSPLARGNPTADQSWRRWRRAIPAGEGQTLCAST
jgi:hypothetical protein